MKTELNSIKNVKIDRAAQKLIDGDKTLKDALVDMASFGTLAERMKIADEIIENVSQIDAFYEAAAKGPQHCIAVINESLADKTMEERYQVWTRLEFGFEVFGTPEYADRIAKGETVDAIFDEVYPNGIAYDGKNITEDINEIQQRMSECFGNAHLTKKEYNDIEAVFMSGTSDGNYEYIGTKYGAEDAFNIKCLTAMEMYNSARKRKEQVNAHDVALAASTSYHIDDVKRARRAGEIGEDVASFIVSTLIITMIVFSITLPIFAFANGIPLSLPVLLVFALTMIGTGTVAKKIAEPLLKTIFAGISRFTANILPNRIGVHRPNNVIDRNNVSEEETVYETDYVEVQEGTVESEDENENSDTVFA